MQRKEIDKNIQEKKQQEEKKGKVTTKVYKTAAFTLGYGESFYAMKVANPNMSTTTIYMRGNAQTYFGGGGRWGTYVTGDPSSIWTNGKGVSIEVVNAGSSGALCNEVQPLNIPK